MTTPYRDRRNCAKHGPIDGLCPDCYESRSNIFAGLFALLFFVMGVATVGQFASSCTVDRLTDRVNVLSSPQPPARPPKPKRERDLADRRGLDAIEEMWLQGEPPGLEGLPGASPPGYYDDHFVHREPQVIGVGSSNQLMLQFGPRGWTFADTDAGLELIGPDGHKAVLR